MAHQHIRRWVTTLTLVVCGTLLLAVAIGRVATAATRTNEQARTVASAQHTHVQHHAAQRLYHISASTLAQEETPSVTVRDQPIVDNRITVDEVIAPQDGWAVVHTLDAQGSPIANQVIGSTQVSAGTNTNVEIELTESFTPGDELQVMLHIDEGTVGTLEFPGGPDTPVAVDGEIVASNFTVQDAEAPADEEQAGGEQPVVTPSPSPEATQMPDTGTGMTTVPLLLILGGLLLIGAAVLRHVSFRPSL